MKDYDPEKPSKFIIYLDMNNMYGWPMSKYLHYERFEWLKNFDGFDVMSIGKKSKIEFILEIDLEYRQKLHTVPRVCNLLHARNHSIFTFGFVIIIHFS